MAVDLAGKSVAITGASSGIGAATAMACARAGMKIALFARRAEHLEAVRIGVERAGGAAIVVVGSVDSDGDCLRLLGETAAAFGSLDVVIANAGYGVEAPAWSMPEADIRAIFETNFYGSLRVVRPAAQMMRGRGGHLVFVSSGLSKIGVPRFAAYSATKAAQDHFARAMRIELAGDGIAVSSVHPVVTETEFSKSADERGREARRFTNRQPKGLTQTPERVADAIVRRLRKGRGGEVWTSLGARLGMGAATAFPGVADAVLGRMYRGRMGG